MATFTRDGLIVPMRTMQTKFGARFQAFMSKLTAIHAPSVGAPKRLDMYRRMNIGGVPHLYLPRTLLKSLPRLFPIRVTLAPPAPLALSLALPMHENQQVVIDHLIENVFTPERIAAGTAACVLNMAAGEGKTHMSAGLACALGLRVCFIVPKSVLAHQGVADYKSCFIDEGDDDGAAPPTIAVYDKRRATADITFMIINSACAMPPEFFEQFGLIVLDEVHSYCSPKRKNIFELTAGRPVLGMSATTNDREDKFDVIAHRELAFDGVIHAAALPGYERGDDCKFSLTADIIRWHGAPEHTRNLTHESTGRVFTHYMHNQFIDDPARTAMIVKEIIALYDWRDAADRRHHIYVFAEEVSILDRARVLIEAELQARDRADIQPLGLELFTGGLKDDEIKEKIHRGRILFSTYGYAGTGVSIPWMSAIVFLTPRKANMKQILARIMRRGSDLNIPRVVVDVVDAETSMCRQQSARAAAYDFYGFTKKKRTMRYDRY